MQRPQWPQRRRRPCASPFFLLQLALGLTLLLVLALVPGSQAFKLPPLGSQRDRPSPPPPDPEPTPKVLVAGATGRVGRLVVKGLVDRGYNVVALTRSQEKAREAFGKVGKDGPITVATADVTDADSLAGPMKGCVACISCVGPTRITRPVRDLLAFLLLPFLKPEQRYPKDHPYFVNLDGMRNLVAAARQAGVPKFIRVSGLSVGYSAFNPVTVLLNLVVSFAVRWQLAAEQALRASGMDYTVIRPGALVDTAATPDDLVMAADGQGVPVGRISRRDVAALCVASLESAKASNATLSCVSTTAKALAKAKDKGKGGEAPAAAAAAAVAEAPMSLSPSAAKSMNDDPLWPYKILLRREGRPDMTPLRGKPHRLAVAVFVLGLSLVAAGASFLLAQGAGWLLAKLRPPSANAATVLAAPASGSAWWSQLTASSGKGPGAGRASGGGGGGSARRLRGALFQ